MKHQQDYAWFFWRDVNEKIKQQASSKEEHLNMVTDIFSRHKMELNGILHHFYRKKIRSWESLGRQLYNPFSDSAKALIRHLGRKLEFFKRKRAKHQRMHRRLKAQSARADQMLCRLEHFDVSDIPELIKKWDT